MTARTGTLDLLSCGYIDVKGRVPWSSNATFLVSVHGGHPDEPAAHAMSTSATLAIYKPGRGERPLWDFPRGLWKREVAAYLLACQLGWPMVPPTVGRPDAPLGAGSLQLFVDADPDEHYFTLLGRPEHELALRRLAIFDLVANNADRKAGHCLLGRDGRIWAIDNGLCFHEEPKLRTVIWDFAGERVEPELLSPLEQLVASGPPENLGELLERRELEAVLARATMLLRKRRFPAPTTSYPYPWPLV